MPAGDELLAICNEWKALTKLEASSIQAANWKVLEQAQEIKVLLQKKLGNLPIAAVELERKNLIQKLVEEILALEKQNAATLARQMELSNLELADMNQGQRTLGKVKSSYLPRQNGVWSSYS